MSGQQSLFAKMRASGMKKVGDRRKGLPARSASQLYGKGDEEAAAGDLDVFRAAAGGSVVLVKELLHQGQPVNSTDSTHRTPLHIAVSRGNLEMVEFLLEHRADPTIKTTDNGEAPLHVSTLAEVSEALLLAKASINEPDEWGLTPLHHAASNGNVDIVRVLAEYKASIDARDRILRTPLLLAAFKGHEKVVEELASNGANLVARDKSGRTAFELAQSMGHLEIGQSLQHMISILGDMGQGGLSLRELPAGSPARLQRGANNQPTQRPSSSGGIPSPPPTVPSRPQQESTGRPHVKLQSSSEDASEQGQQASDVLILPEEEEGGGGGGGGPA